MTPGGPSALAEEEEDVDQLAPPREDDDDDGMGGFDEGPEEHDEPEPEMPEVRYNQITAGFLLSDCDGHLQSGLVITFRFTETICFSSSLSLAPVCQPQPWVAIAHRYVALWTRLRRVETRLLEMPVPPI